MKQFASGFFGSCLGIVVGIFLFILISTAIIGGMISSAVSVTKEKIVEVKPNTILKLDFSYRIPEKSRLNPFENIEIPGYNGPPSFGLNDIVKSIKAAKNDDNIKGIYLSAGSLPNGMATIEAIRNALLDFKESGKFIVAYGEIVTQKSYYLCSVADKIYVNPQGGLEFSGFAAQLMFFKGTLEKLGIEPQIFYAGKFKSATEPFRFTKMSDPNRKQIRSYLTGIYDNILENISESRGIPVALIDSVADNLLIQKAQDAVTYKFVDNVKYYDEVLAELKELTGFDIDEDLEALTLRKYSKSIPAGDLLDKSNSKVAVIYAQGSIVDGKGDEDNIGSARYAKMIRKVREDEDVKAIVFRVNSGGGSALASEVILRELELANENVPVVVSMGNVAASGGYYIASGADEIFAQPNTITGSIGVFGLLPNMKEFFNNKLGITFDTEKTGKYSDMGTPGRPLTAEEGAIIQKAVNRIYIEFKQRVADGRGITMEYVDSVAQGRVWTGEQALALGLVDKLGGLNDAIASVVEKAELEEYDLDEYPKIKNPFEAFLEELSDGASAKIIKNNLGDDYVYYKKIKEIKEMKGIQARQPFEIEIY